MGNSSDFDVVAAHKYFAASCFNRAWDLIEKMDRTPDDELLMVALNQASIYHWLNRPDCENKSLSVGYWQASRIHAILRNASEAKRYAEICLGYSNNLEPFYLGYAHEALARAAKLEGETKIAAEHLSLAREQAQLVNRKEDRELLINDLVTLI